MNGADFAAIQAAAHGFVTSSGVPIFWPNTRIAPPTDSQGNPLTYIWSEIIGLGGEQASVGAPGANLFKDTGFIRFYIMTPIGQGLNYDLAAQLAAVYRLATIGDVQCLAPTPPEAGGNSDDGNWCVTAFSVPFFLHFFG